MKTLRELLPIYQAYFKSTVAVQLQYRAELVIWLIGMVLEPVIYLVVWATVAHSRGGVVGGFTAGDFASYFIVLMMVEHLTFTWVMWEFEWRIRQGTLSPQLLRPLHPIHADVANNVVYKGLTLMVMLPTAGLLSWVFHARWHLHLWSTLASLPALLLAFLVRFLLEWALALSAFWVTRVRAVNQFYYVTVLFLSGQVAPLSLLPSGLQYLSEILPFRWMVAFPVELFLGRLTPKETFLGFLAQGFWLTIGILLVKILWRAGIRRYSAVGI